MPPLVPEQVQFQGPIPVTVDAEPVVQRFVDGALVDIMPLELPQTPLIGSVMLTLAANELEIFPAASFAQA